MVPGAYSPGRDTLDRVIPRPVLWGLAWVITEYERKVTSRSPRPERLGRSSVVVPGFQDSLPSRHRAGGSTVPEDFDRRPAGVPA